MSSKCPPLCQHVAIPELNEYRHCLQPGSLYILLTTDAYLYLFVKLIFEMLSVTAKGSSIHFRLTKGCSWERFWDRKSFDPKGNWTTSLRVHAECPTIWATGTRRLPDVLEYWLWLICRKWVMLPSHSWHFNRYLVTLCIWLRFITSANCAMIFSQSLVCSPKFSQWYWEYVNIESLFVYLFQILWSKGIKWNFQSMWKMIKRTIESSYGSRVFAFWAALSILFHTCLDCFALHNLGIGGCLFSLSAS